MSASRDGSARGQALFALASVAFLVVALTWLDRAGPKAPALLAAGEAPSGAWICPHGGGRDLSVALFIANPGEDPATVRVTQLGAEKAAPPAGHVVPGGTTVQVNLPPGARGDATSVEFFGGWVGVGWASFTDAGAAAEPCVAEASQRWYLADGSTELGEESYVVVANPFSGPAVMDVVLYSADQPPVRQSEWTDLVVPARQSVALHLNEQVKGEPVVATTLDVSVGRVAAASLVVSDRTTVRSAIGWTEPGTGAWFPTMQGSGQSELVLLSTSSGSIRFGATSLSEDQPRPAGGLTEQEHGPTAARAYAVPEGAGPTAIRLFTLEGALVSGALRVLGPGTDLGSTGGSVAASDAWVLLPASAQIRAEPGAVLVNDGDVAVVASVELLPQEGGTAPSTVSVTVPPHATAEVPPDLWASAPGSALVVRADGPILALSATSSPGPQDTEAFALSMGVQLLP